jgi:hypothetical protein
LTTKIQFLNQEKKQFNEYKL